jgi:hypothetical protein
VVLRHQLAILRRGGRRPRYTAADRALLAAASRLLPAERWSCFAVSPQTLRRWHRALLQGNRRRRGRRPGRPPLAAETRSLILRLARENPRWGYMRIQGELLKLGINVSATTVATVLRVSGLGPAPRRIGPSWSAFLRAQAQSMLSGSLRSGPGGGLEGNVSARRAATPEGAPGRSGSRGGLHQPCRGAVARLAAGVRSAAAVGGRCSAFSLRVDGRSAAVIAAMACARWTKHSRRSLRTRTGRPGCQSRRLHARGVRAATTGRFPGAAARPLTLAPQHNGPTTAPSRQLNRVSLPHTLRELPYLDGAAHAQGRLIPT